MDIIGHTLYGATLCSRTGLAGGRHGGAAFRGRFDWTIWAAVGFSLLPDLASIGVAFADMAMQGHGPSFHRLPPYVFVLYRFTHSLIVAGLFVLLLRVVARPVAVPALAWPVHVAIDSVLHGNGRWQASLFFPVFDWRVPGVNWWERGDVMLAYWIALPALWLAIHLWRRSAPRSDRQIATPAREPS